MNPILIGAIARKHYFLSIVNPKDELLKYFTIDEEGGFKMCLETDFEEYINRFRGDLMSIDDFVEQFTDYQKREINTNDIEEYHKELFLATMENYLSALYEEIDRIEKSN